MAASTLQLVAGLLLSALRAVPVLAKAAEWAGAPVMRVSWEPPPATGEVRYDPNTVVAGSTSRLVSGSSDDALRSDGPNRIETSSITKGANWRWFHVRVRNVGRLPAFDARGFVRMLWVKRDGTFEPHPDWVGRMRLRWANLDQEELLLRRRDSGPWDRLDVFRLPELGRRLHLVTPLLNAGLPTELPAGEYRLLIDVESASARSESCVLAISYDGAWDTVQVHQVPLDSVGVAS